MKTVYKKRTDLLKPFSLVLLNNITEIDNNFIEDNFYLFSEECETCNGAIDIEKDGKIETCEDCYGNGSHDLEPYQMFIIDCDKWDKEHLESWGFNIGYSELLDHYILAIYDFGTGWYAFSNSKEVEDDYVLGPGESFERLTVY